MAGRRRRKLAAPFDAPQPVIDTRRLRLRPYTLADVDELLPLLNHPSIAAATPLPYPYPRSRAAPWIRSNGKGWREGTGTAWAITIKRSGRIVGTMGIKLQLPHRRGEIGYWMGVRDRGKGYTSEAAIAVVRFGFEALGLNRIEAHHLGFNRASGAVLRKAGMRREGRKREYLLRGGVPHDIIEYAILRADRRP